MSTLMNDCAPTLPATPHKAPHSVLRKLQASANFYESIGITTQ